MIGEARKGVILIKNVTKVYKGCVAVVILY